MSKDDKSDIEKNNIQDVVISNSDLPERQQYENNNCINNHVINNFHKLEIDSVKIRYFQF